MKWRSSAANCDLKRPLAVPRLVQTYIAIHVLDVHTQHDTTNALRETVWTNLLFGYFEPETIAKTLGQARILMQFIQQ